MKTRKKGFTLIELLTVIAIIGILAAIIIPTVGRVRDSAKRAKCMSNVRQIAVSLIAAANQTKQQTFPSMTVNTGWAWDVPHALAKELVNNSGREVFYCPSSFMLTSFTIKNLYEFSGYPNGYAVTTYVMIIPGNKHIRPEFINNRLQANYDVTGVGSVPSSMKPLVVDAVISNGQTFVGVQGGLVGADNVSSHMTGNNPLGAHTGYVDGHVKWRKFVKAISLTDPMDKFTNGFAISTTGMPSFWW